MSSAFIHLLALCYKIQIHFCEYEFTDKNFYMIIKLQEKKCIQAEIKYISKVINQTVHNLDEKQPGISLFKSLNLPHHRFFI
jgi:hypothetical protein